MSSGADIRIMHQRRFFHANKEIKNAGKNNLKTLKLGNSVSEDKATIEEKITKFFHALFNGHHGTNLQDTGEPFKADKDLDNFLHDLSALPDSERDNQEIVGKCDHNKSPGLDGLCYEFYQETFPAYYLGLNTYQL